jgi:hypothetical protein
VYAVVVQLRAAAAAAAATVASSSGLCREPQGKHRVTAMLLSPVCIWCWLFGSLAVNSPGCVCRIAVISYDSLYLPNDTHTLLLLLLQVHVAGVPCWWCCCLRP